LRISDILAIKSDEIAKVMNVYERKTRKFKKITLSDDLWGKIRPKIFNTSNFAFASKKTPHKHISRITYHRHLKRACEAARSDCSAHSTRKLYARNIFERTGSIEAVQKALNHKYITTTAAYLDIDVNQLVREATER